MNELPFNHGRWHQEVGTWHKEQKENLRYEYDNIDKKFPIFFDLGGYHGNWSKKIVEKYGGESHIFEVLPIFQDKIKANLTSSNYIVNDFALGSTNTTIQISTDNPSDGSSFHRNVGESKVDAKIVCCEDYINEKNIDFIDIVKINIEGAEYDLLEHILSKSLHLKMDNLQIQFHFIYDIPRFHERWLNIREQLVHTHYLTYDFYYVWENWKLK
jgi:FkbM family methyltransferase